jgi:NADH:ubiquinone oxidoreductase subunit B-like Fe-S oxidoreductase
VERRAAERQAGYPRPSRVAILHFGIACCALTMAIVIAVAIVASH